MQRQAEILATISGDEARDEADNRRIPLELAMIDYDSRPSRTPSCSVADWAISEALPFPPFTVDVVSDASLGAKHPENPLEHIDKQVHFVSGFQKLAAQRRKVRRLRVRARDGRGQLKATRHRLHGALQRFFKTIEAHPFGLDSDPTLMKDLETAEVACDELNSEDIAQDIVESDLLPEEWELEDSERRLYEAVLGPSASDEEDDLDIDLGTTVPPDRRPTKAHVDRTYLPGPDEATADERLLALVEERRHLKESLENQEKEYTALSKDMEMRMAAGVPIDIFSRNTLEDFGERRGQLLKHIARLSFQISELEAMSSEASLHDSRQSNVLFGLHQFHDLETRKYIQAPKDGDSPILQLYDDDDGGRKADMDSFLGQPLLEQLERMDGLQEQNPVPAIVPYSSLMWEVDDELLDNLTNYVSLWILGCIQSSWWSFTRLAAWVDTAGKFTVQATTELVKATWFEDGAGLSSSFVWSEDPRSSIVSEHHMDATLTPTSGTVGMWEPLWQVDGPERRHTSGYSGGKSHQQRVPSHSHPGTGRVERDPPVPSDSVWLAP
ncbi:hypothetical protein G647_09793 [Cladophialophora carrionii CBS 160.54]|uniref:Uncharacterized protein n=1 Tax=Cladophialophora carrionii CBS 160.54 TaxID=1279043 RepID=V9DK93_9EURO|nr:uncharacterized protein G647_09793 [Cladophialophora carrionii CBS 160.54]ETI27111.1 hypothetical protein G647_09793 [Cladophialophora carrionii CBS 160.54]